MNPMRQLTLIQDGRKVAEYLLDLPNVIIGRGSAANIKLDGNPVVSRQHALVREQGGGHVIEDLGGANGTFIDGRPISIHTLRPGQRIVLGTDTLRYDFGSRSATSLRGDTVPVSDDEDVETLDEISVADVEMVAGVGSLREIGEMNRERVPASSGISETAGAERTKVASKDELERMLAEMTIKAKPHLRRLAPGDDPSDKEAGELVALEKSPVVIGHREGSGVKLPGSRFLLPGKVAGSLTMQAGRWHITPESPFWNPLLLNGDKLEKIRMLEPGDVFEARGQRFVYERGA